MIVAKKSYNTLNYAVNDNYAYDYRKYDIEENERIKNEKLKTVKRKSAVKRKIKLMSAAIVMFVLGTLIVGRYALIMDLNNQSINLRTEISENQKVNDDLKLQLMKYSDITRLEKYATEEIKMVRPGINNIIHVNVAGLKPQGSQAKQDKQEEPSEKLSFFGKIISFFE